MAGFSDNSIMRLDLLISFAGIILESKPTQEIISESFSVTFFRNKTNRPVSSALVPIFSFINPMLAKGMGFWLSALTTCPLIVL